MFGSIWNFVKRHRRKLVVTGVVLGGVVYLGRYARQKLRDFQEKEASECLALARRQHHFDSNQRTCNVTALSMLPTLREALLGTLNAEELTTLLKEKPPNKVEIWEDLKIISFARIVVAVYSCCLMTVMLRVQLNIVGGYMYLANLSSKPDALSQTSEMSGTVSSDVQKQYLALIQFFLDKGLLDLTSAVKQATEELLKEIPLKKNISLLEIQELIRSIRNRIEYRQTNGYHDATASSLCAYLLPEDSVPEASKLTPDEIMLSRLKKETADMLSSGDFHSILTICLDTGFMRLVDRLADYFRPTPTENGVIINPNQITMPMAKVIPIMTGLVHVVLRDTPNPFIQELLLKDQVRDFAANVYEAFSHPSQGQQLP